jgi:hypothetical protein
MMSGKEEEKSANLPQIAKLKKYLSININFID